jgi:hypothetical protein
MPGNEVTTYMRDEMKVIEIRTAEAKYQGIPWRECSEFQKRKYENFTYLSNNTGYPMKFIYI